MARWPLVLMLATMVGCSRPCKEGTVFLSIHYSGSAVDADEIQSTVSSDGASGTFSKMQRASGPLDTLEIDFQTRYPQGRTITIEATALKQGAPIARGQAVATLGPNCTTLSVTVAPPRLMFVTSKTYIPGSLGGLAGADAICLERAQAGQLRGDFVAWLSTSNPAIDAKSRLRSASGWQRSDGMPFAASLDALLGHQLLSPPSVDESAQPVNDTNHIVATNTAADGTLSSVDQDACADWTASAGHHYTAGDFTSMEEAWTAEGVGFLCEGPGVRIYCFGVDPR